LKLYCLGQDVVAASYEEANEIPDFIEDEEIEEPGNVILSERSCFMDVVGWLPSSYGKCYSQRTLMYGFKQNIYKDKIKHSNDSRLYVP